MTDGRVPDPPAPDASVGGMLYVPAGPFVMGSDPTDGSAQPEEMPEHIVTVAAFHVDAHEVTNADYRACVTAAACTAPASASSSTRTAYYTNPAYDDHPVIHVSWAQASTYCAWAGKRLPTEAEWEKAARGGCETPTCGAQDEGTYPWGDTVATCDLANGYLGGFCVPGGDADVVGTRSPSGDSPYGARDMAGNVWEWVADWYLDTYYASSPDTDPSGPANGALRVLRGGSWLQGGAGLRVAYRYSSHPADNSNQVGFRCARSP
jgi:serine/threonine-protein kinase